MPEGERARRSGGGLAALRAPVYRILDPLKDWMVRRRVHPNLLTTLGFALTVIAGVFYAVDHVRTAGALVLLGGAFDVFDGRVARLSGLVSKFGSFYDSTLDRISEVVVYLGLLSLYNRYQADLTMIDLILLATAGSLMVSYTRARAEALGLDCTVGFMQRPERIVLLGGRLAALRLDVGGEGHQHRHHRRRAAHQRHRGAAYRLGAAPCLGGAA